MTPRILQTSQPISVDELWKEFEFMESVKAILRQETSGPRTFEESYKAIREAGGDAYDGIDVEQHLAAMRGQPQGTEARVCDDITERQALGINKYGKTVEQSDASLRQWLQHAYEEVLDTAIYLRRAIEQMDKTSDKPQYPVHFSPDVAQCKAIILQWMKDFDVSYRELSQMCGLPASNIHAMLKGNRRMTKASADAIFKAINDDAIFRKSV